MKCPRGLGLSRAARVSATALLPDGGGRSSREGSLQHPQLTQAHPADRHRDRCAGMA